MPLAAVCCALAVTGTVQVLRPAPPPSSVVLVTTREVAAGTELTEEDVARRAVAADVAPEGTLSRTAEAAGRTAVVGLPEGVPLHAGVLSDGGLLAAAPHGTVVVAVSLADDDLTTLLRPGDHVDLLAPGDGRSAGPAASAGPPDVRYLARRALVLPTPERRSPDDGSPTLLGSGSDPPAVTLVAVSPDEAPELSAIAGLGAVSAILVR